MGILITNRTLAPQNTEDRSRLVVDASTAATVQWRIVGSKSWESTPNEIVPLARKANEVHKLAHAGVVLSNLLADMGYGFKLVAINAKGEIREFQFTEA